MYGQNKRAGTDARHSRAGKDAMVYTEKGEPLCQVDAFTANSTFNNYQYTPLGQNRELEANNTLGVKLTFSEIVVLDGHLFNQVMRAITNGESPVLTFEGVIEGRNGSQERVCYRECIFSGDNTIQDAKSGDVLKRNFSMHCNGAIENKKKLTI